MCRDCCLRGGTPVPTDRTLPLLNRDLYGFLGGAILPVTDEQNVRRDAFRLERVEDDGATVTIAFFYSVTEANTLINHLDQRYRMMLGDRQIWPDKASSNRHDDGAG